MNKYKYKPITFYVFTYIFTWAFWISAAILGKDKKNFALSMVLMVFGLLVPAVVAFIMVRRSKCEVLQKDYRNKLVGFYRVNWLNLIVGAVLFGIVIAASILVSTMFGESLDQFSFVGGFSFSIGSALTLLVLVLTSAFEELGWRGYAEDSIAFHMDWHKESWLFGVVWALWHLPLFFIPNTYQANILAMSPWYMVNFFVSAIPLGFFPTWIYVKNKRSIFACIIVHFFVNFFQEQIAMTQKTKCVETFVISLVCVGIVWKNRDMFFETRHVGDIDNFVNENQTA